MKRWIPVRTGRFAHALFGGVVALLLVLATWWVFFLAQMVGTEDALIHRQLELEARLIAHEFSEGALREGPVPGHPGFEGVRQGASSALVVAPEEAKLREHAGRVTRRRVQIYGEGALLLALVLGCVGMLYRLVLAEQRYRRDVDAFMGGFLRRIAVDQTIVEMY